MTLTEIRNVLDDMISKGVRMGDTLYKICPICNSNHKGSCERCAWRGTMNVCDVGVGVWSDGSYCEKPLQIVPRKLYNGFDSVIFKLWNIQYFATEEDARKAMEEYDNIRKESNRDIRVAKYDLWEEKQRCKYVPAED